MSDHKSASRKFLRDDEDPNPITPHLPHDTGSPSSDTSISSDPFPPRDERPRSSDSAPATPEASDEVRLPGAEPSVFADPPAPAGDTRLVSLDGSASAVTSKSGDVQSPSSNASKDPKETELSPWLIWYLHKDIEWRKRLQEQRESRSRRRLQREMSAQLKAKQKAEAERVFRSWCKAKTEEKRELTLEKQRRQEELEADKLRKKQRLRELSKQKYKEWLETKREREAIRAEEKADDSGTENLEKTLATQRAFALWLKGKKGSKCTAGIFYVKCINGHLVGYWE